MNNIEEDSGNKTGVLYTLTGKVKIKGMLAWRPSASAGYSLWYVYSLLVPLLNTLTQLTMTVLIVSCLVYEKGFGKGP